MVTSFVVTSFMVTSFVVTRLPGNEACQRLYAGSGMVSSIKQLSRSLSCRQHSPCPCQGLLDRAGGVDRRPVERAEVVTFLRPRNRHVGIGGVTRASPDTGQSGRQTRREKQAVEVNVAGCSRLGDSVALLRLREHGIDDRRMPGGKDAARLVDESGIDTLAHRRRIGVLRQLFGLADAEQRFALDI